MIHCVNLDALDRIIVFLKKQTLIPVTIVRYNSLGFPTKKAVSRKLCPTVIWKIQHESCRMIYLPINGVPWTRLIASHCSDAPNNSSKYSPNNLCEKYPKNYFNIFKHFFISGTIYRVKCIWNPFFTNLIPSIRVPPFFTIKVLHAYDKTKPWVAQVPVKVPIYYVWFTVSCWKLTFKVAWRALMTIFKTIFNIFQILKFHRFSI